MGVEFDWGQGVPVSSETDPSAVIPEGLSVIVPTATKGSEIRMVPVAVNPEGVLVRDPVEGRESAVGVRTPVAVMVPEGVLVMVPEARRVSDWQLVEGEGGRVMVTRLHWATDKGQEGVPEHWPEQEPGTGTGEGWGILPEVGAAVGVFTGGGGFELGSIFSQGSGEVSVGVLTLSGSGTMANISGGGTGISSIDGEGSGTMANISGGGTGTTSIEGEGSGMMVNIWEGGTGATWGSVILGDPGGGTEGQLVINCQQQVASSQQASRMVPSGQLWVLGPVQQETKVEGSVVVGAWLVSWNKPREKKRVKKQKSTKEKGEKTKIKKKIVFFFGFYILY
jgi:hypothetical protein